MFIIIVLGSIPTLKPIYDRFVLKKSRIGSSRKRGYPSESSYNKDVNQAMLFPFNQRNAPSHSTRVYSEDNTDEIALQDIHVRNDFEVLSHEEDGGKNAVVGQNVV